MANHSSLRFVGNSEHNYNVTILRLGDEFGNYSNVVQGSLCICQSHWSIENINRAELSRVVPAILTAREGVEVEINPNAIFTSPLNRLEEVSMICQPKRSMCLYETYCQEVLARKGSPVRVSMAQYGRGILTKLSPAPAISAKSCSVYQKGEKEQNTDFTGDLSQ